LVAKSTTDLTAQGARFLNERPCTRLCMWMVYSRVTTSASAERCLPVWKEEIMVSQLRCRFRSMKQYKPFWSS
jgi:hypothetical protein